MIDFFEPFDITSQPHREIKENPFPSLRTHLFNLPFTHDISKVQVQNSMFMLGRRAELKHTKDMLKQFIHDSSQSKFVLVSGEFGIGKSLFVRNLLYYGLKDVVQSDNIKWKFNETAHFLVSNLDSYTEILRFCGWRSIFKELLSIFSNRMRCSPESALLRIFASNERLKRNLVLLDEIIDTKFQRKQGYKKLTVISKS